MALATARDSRVAHYTMETVMRNVFLAGAGLVAGVALTLVTTTVQAGPHTAEADAHQAAVKAQVIAVTFQLDTSGFHDLEESTAAGAIPRGALGSVRRARIATQATDWPDPLREKAAELVSHMMALEDGLRAEDPDVAAQPAHDVHEVGHDLSTLVYTWLGGQSAPSREQQAFHPGR